MTDEKKVVDKDSHVSEEGKKDIEIARIAQQRMREQAPETMVNESVEIPQKKLIRQFCPEAVGPNATHHAWFGDKELYNQNLNEGNEPVYNRGHKVKYGRDGDVMLKIPIKLHEKRKQAEAD